MTEQSMEHHEQQHNNNSQETTNLVCRWNDCLKVFPNHAALASHLSEDHVGWKKGDYFCDWSNCARQGAKCHNRFALMMHLRIHTGEKPFECNVPNCGQTFGRMDALVRHKKAEHGEGNVDGKSNATVKPISAPLAATATTMIPQRSSSNNNNNSPHYFNSTKGVKRGHKMDTLSKMAGKKSRHGSYYHSSGDESDDSIAGSSSIQVAASQKSSSSSSLLSGSADYNRYRLAKAQLHYILRENEMLQDEYGLAQKKLKRMKTERRVLLQALMAKEKSRPEEEKEEDTEEEEEQDTTTSISFEQQPTITTTTIIPTNHHHLK